jgi:hypothetical protein
MIRLGLNLLNKKQLLEWETEVYRAEKKHTLIAFS